MYVCMYVRLVRYAHIYSKSVVRLAKRLIGHIGVVVDVSGAEKVGAVPRQPRHARTPSHEQRFNMWSVVPRPHLELT